MELNIKGNVICTNKKENTWGIRTTSINDESKEVLLIDQIKNIDKREVTETSTVVGLEIILEKCGIKKEFNDGEEVEITIKF